MSGLHAEVRPGSGTPIVLLHGFGSSGATWRAVADALGGRAVIVYDLPGHRGSLDFPEAGPPSLAAKAIIADIAERQIGKVHLAGHSMGGAISTLVAMMAPQLVASLTLLAPGGYGPEINAPLLRRYASAASADEIAECLKEMSGPHAQVLSAEADEIAQIRQAPGQIAMLEKIVAIITRGERQGVIPAENVAKIPVPVTVVWGTGDPVLPDTQMAATPGHWLRISLPEIGHMLIDEAPAKVAEIIRNQADSTPL